MSEIINGNHDKQVHQDGKSRSKQVEKAQAQHMKLMQEIIERHGLPRRAANELEAIHTHHHSLAFNLVHRETLSQTAVDQKVKEQASKSSSPSRPQAAKTRSSSQAKEKADSSPRKKSVEAVHHVHALVMEEVMAKHRVRPEAVEELLKEQERHKLLLADLLTRTNGKNRKGEDAKTAPRSSRRDDITKKSKAERDALLSKATTVQQVQENHKQLMLAIMQKKQVTKNGST